MQSKIQDCGGNLPPTEALYWTCKNEAIIKDLSAELERLRAAMVTSAWLIDSDNGKVASELLRCTLSMIEPSMMH